MTATFIFTDKTKLNFRVGDKAEADKLALRSFPGKVVHVCGPWCKHHD